MLAEKDKSKLMEIQAALLMSCRGLVQWIDLIIHLKELIYYLRILTVHVCYAFLVMLGQCSLLQEIHLLVIRNYLPALFAFNHSTTFISPSSRYPHSVR